MSHAENIAVPTRWPIPSILPSMALSGNTYETISLVCGYVSILCWICVFSPQLYQNYRRKSGDSLSVSFLVIWLLGDLFNVAGVLMQGLLDTMLVLAIYYTAADIGLIIQIYYYRYFATPEGKDEEAELSDDDLLDLETSDATRITFGDGSDARTRTAQIKEMRMQMQCGTRSVTSDSTISSATLTPTLDSATVPARRCPARRTLLAAVAIVVGLTGCAMVAGVGEVDVTKRDVTGRKAIKHHSEDTYSSFSATVEDSGAVDPMAQIMGWISAALYVGSRIPQLIKNFKSKSCEGLSGAMFSMSVLGNVTYSLSILVMLPVIAESALDENRRGNRDAGEAVYTYLAKTIPWLVGSTGTLLFDFSILVQFLIYQRKANDTNEEEQPTERSPLLCEDRSCSRR